VGITEQPPWTLRTEPKETRDAGAVGIEPDLAKGFANQLDAKVQWIWGSEQQLFDALERFELDMAIGGFTDDNPWKKRVGFTKPYFEHEQTVVEGGERTSRRERHVIAVQPGENRFLLALDRFLRDKRSFVVDAHGERR
jgi:ABC-type amino acid transport substrate-binding protein